MARPEIIARGYLKKVLRKDEQVLFLVHRHWWVLLAKTVGWATLTVGMLAFAGWLYTLQPEMDAWIWAAGFSALPFVMWIWEWLVWETHIHVMTNRRVLQIKGVLNKDVIDTAVEKLNDVRTRQSLLGRILGYGDIEIITASDNVVNELRTIDNPLGFKRRMLEAKDALATDTM